MNNSEKLKEYRTKNKMGQMDTALKLGVSYNAYLQWEKGFEPNEENQAKIDDLLSKGVK